MSEVAELKQGQARTPVETRPEPRAAEGPRIYDLFPPLIGPVERWFDHLPRIAGMGFNWVLVSDAQEAPLSEDSERLKAFAAAARRQNLQVMTDLAAGSGPPGPAPGIHLADPEAYLHRCLDWGIDGFICRYAAYVPAKTWAGLIADARKAAAGTCFIADTLGSGPAGAAMLDGAGFDYLLNSTAWWDFRGDWLPEEQRRQSLVAPTLSFPEARETERLAGQAAPEQLEAWMKFRLLFAAVFSGGWMMPLGCEYGFRHRLDLRRTTPADWEAGR